MNFGELFFYASTCGVLGGILGAWLARLWWGRQPAPPRVVREPREPRECSNSLCHSGPDPRCAAGNCTEHCQSSFGCNGRCLDAWVKAGRAFDVAQSVLVKARHDK